MPLAFHARKTALAILLSFAFSTASVAVDAVSLGRLTVESKPGQPMDAVLEIDDVDLTVSPLLVRVAPPATYLRQGVQWPEQARDLRIAKDQAAQGVRVRVVGDEGVQGTFPLLIELNAGGVVSVREYTISAKDGAFVVEPAAEHTTVDVRAIKAAEATRQAQTAAMDEVPAKTAAAAPDAAALKAADEPAPKRKRGRYAPAVVKEYVALNGFSADESFRIAPDMTLWSIAKLYWPAFPGATLEQLSQAFAQKNPAAFESGDVSRLVAGEVLNPPSAEQVFAIDAKQAFESVHGAKTPVPAVTQTLMDAQAVSRECAAAVGKAQNEKREAGAGTAEIEKAGEAALAAFRAAQTNDAPAGAPSAEPSAAAPTEAQSAQAVQTEQTAPALQGAESPASPAAPAPESAEPAAEPQPQAASEITTEAASEAPAETSAEASSEASSEAPQSAEALAPAEAPQPSEPPAAADAQNAVDAAQPATEQKTASEAQTSSDAPAAADRSLWAWLAAAVLALGALLLYRRRSSGKASEDSEKPFQPKQGTVAFQSKVTPANDAQLKAVEATVTAAVKNGTTAGAIGEGEYAYTRAQIEAAQAERAKAQAAAADEAAPKTTVQAPAQTMPAAEPEAPKPFVPPADQPWLDPLSDELPPLDEEAQKSAMPQGPLDITSAVEGVSLDLESTDEGKDAAKPAEPKAPEVPERDLLNPDHWVVTEEEPPAARYVPPLEPEPITPAAAPVKAAPEAAPAVLSAAPAKPAAPVIEQSEKQKAQWQAYDAKLKLASSFIGLGALNEADELLEEIAKHGSDAQRAQAKFLSERIAPNLRR